MKRLGLIGLAVGAVAFAPLAVRANARAETEEARVADILQSTLVAHGGEVNRCFERALADTLDVAGKIELAVDVGADGRITKAAPALDEVKSPVLLACLQEAAVTWTMAGLEPGSTVIVPLAFEGQPNQFSIKLKDAPEHGPPAPHGKKHGAPGASPPFSVKLLVDEATMHARQASMAELTVGPANRIALHKHPGAELLYLRKGHARVLGPSGVAPQKLDEGEAIFIPPGMPHAIENMGRSASAVMLQVFVPMGPERVYRDPKDEAGRAAFQVIHGAAAAPPGARFVTGSAADCGDALDLGRQGSRAPLARSGEDGRSGRLPRPARSLPGRRGSPPQPLGLRGDSVRAGGKRRAHGRQREDPLPGRRGPAHSREPASRRPVHGWREDGDDPNLRARRTRGSVPHRRIEAWKTGRRRPLNQEAQPMINLELSEEQRVLQSSVREMCERLIIPNARRWDEEEHFPQEIIPALGEMGLLGMVIPEAYGGAGMKLEDYVIALEEVARADASVGLTMASHNSLCSGHIFLAGTEAQKKKYLPQLASGRVLGGWGLPSPERARTPAPRARGRCGRAIAGSSTGPRPSSPKARWAASTS